MTAAKLTNSSNDRGFVRDSRSAWTVYCRLCRKSRVPSSQLLATCTRLGAATAWRGQVPTSIVARSFATL